MSWINRVIDKIRKKKFQKLLNNTQTAKDNNDMILNMPEDRYKDLISNSPIEKILQDMPENLTQMEKAYYIYIELGKIVKENPQFVFNNKIGKKEHYNDPIDNAFYGMCKSISELYVSILRDERIGIQADLVRRYRESEISHIDTIIKIDGKNYIVNLISDLSRIKSSRRVNSFAFDLNRNVRNPKIMELNKYYLDMLEKHYGKIDSLTRKQVEQLDKKLGYSYFVPQFQKNSERGIYTEDTIELLRKEFDNPELFREYVLHNKEVPEEEKLKYKLEYIFENIDKLTENKGDMGYLENIRYYLSIAKKVLSIDEVSRIQAYAANVGDDASNIISILKVKSLKRPDDNNEAENNNVNWYYLYSKEDKKYVSKTPEEMKKFIEGLDKDSLQIVGTFDRYNPRPIDELEL